MPTWYKVTYKNYLFPIHPVAIVQAYPVQKQVILEEDEDGNKGPVRRKLCRVNKSTGELESSYHPTWREAKAALVAERRKLVAKAQERVSWCRKRLRMARELNRETYLRCLE